MSFTALCSFLILVVSHMGYGLPKYNNNNNSASPAEHAALGPCDGVNAAPILYHPYNDDECPARLQKEENGFCSHWEDYTEEGCASFCQTSKFYLNLTESLENILELP